MGYAGKWGEKLKAQELRRRGCSYSEILKEVTVSKSTISHWCRDIVLTPEQMERLYRRKGTNQRKGSVVSAKKKQEKRFREREILRLKGVSEIGRLDKKSRFVAGVALYAAEGDKSDDYRVGFSNSDPVIIRFMMGWLREYCKVPEDKFKGAIWIHDNLDEGRAKRFWSKLTGIPISQFHKSYIAENKVNSKKIRKNKHPYGVFTVRFGDTKLKRKLFGWIDGILGAT